MLIAELKKHQKNLHHLKNQKDRKKNHILNVSGLAKLTNQSGNNSAASQNAPKMKANLKVKPKVVKKAVAKKGGKEPASGKAKPKPSGDEAA